VAGEERKGEPESKPDLDDFDAMVAGVSNADLLLVIDLVLLELEKRLLRYARVGADILEMADEGLVLAVRAGARLRQAQSSAAHTAGHLQLVGVGEWQPRSTSPSWGDDPRVTGEEE
jgi:hypothetical protein